MVEKMATTGSGYSNGLGITSGVGSTQHFLATGSTPSTPPTLTFSAVTAGSGTWTGGDGNWTDSANWAGSTVAEGIGQAATINGGAAVNITMDTNRSVGSLSFSGADHTLSSGSGKLALNVVSGSPTISVAATRTATIGATVVGIDGLAKSGDGNLTLTGANTFTGTTTISGGTVQVGNGGSTGSIGSSAVVNNASLVYNLDSNGTVSLPSGANISGSGNLSATGGVIQFKGDITQGGALSFTQAGGSGYYKGLEVATSTTLTGSSITLSGDVGKKEAGSHTLALDTSASNGTISLNISLGRNFVWYNLSSFSANAGTGAINITGGGGTGWAGTPVTLTGAVNMTGNVSSDAAVTIDSNTTTTGNISAAFSGGMSLTKSGSGTLALTGANSYGGNTTVNEGTLTLGDGNSNSGLADTADVIVASGATLELNYLAGNTDTIDELWLGGVQRSPGVYGAGNYSGVTITGTGTLTVQNGPPADPFANWMATNYPSIVSPDNQPGADPDNDGIANLVEYLLQGGDPSVSTTGILPTLDASGANFVFTYFRRAAAVGTTQTFEYSTTLGAGSWTPVAIPGSGVTVSPNTPSAGIDQVQIIVAKGANTKLFGRLQVTQP